MPATLRRYAAPATLISVAVMVAFAVVGATAVDGGQARASQVSCGDTITADTTLHQDLVNCPNRGIEIGADGVTLDLNGHLVDGDGTPVADCNVPRGPCDVGLFNDSHDGVTVMHGSVREFESGVLFGTATGRARNNRVLGISATRNQFTGIGIFSQVRGLVRNSSGNRSLDREHGEGLGLADSNHVRIVNNSFRRNAHNGITTGDMVGRNVIRGNLFSRNDDEGILMEGGERFRVTGNRFVRNGGGITLGPGSRNVIADNRISGGRDGIRVEKGHDNLVADNVVVGTRHVGITLGIHDPFIGGAHNVVRRNLVRDSRVDGFVVVKKDTNSLLSGNIAKGAGDDGFDVDSRSAKLTGNHAVGNADLGIEAVFGVIDGGGNVGRHNGDPRQCTHIFCR
jgi:parallel beta-helix repeat protein